MVIPAAKASPPVVVRPADSQLAQAKPLVMQMVQVEWRERLRAEGEFEGQAEDLDLLLSSLVGRAPLIGRLGFGELRIVQHGRTRRFFVDGGFAQVRNNIVTVLTPRAVRGEDINTQAATQMLEAPSTPAASLEERVAQQKNQQRARAQLRVARRTRGEV